MAFAIKAEVHDARAKAFAFVAQKTMYGGKHIVKGDTIFVFASGNERGQGLIARGVVASTETVAKKRGIARQTPRVSILERLGGAATARVPSPRRGRVSLSRLRRVTDAEIRRTSPPELADLPANFWSEAEVVASTPKRAISLRLDEHVLDWFRRSGPGYQTRRNAVLPGTDRLRGRRLRPRMGVIENDNPR